VPEVTVEEKWGGTVGRKNGRAEAVEEKEPEPEQPSSGHAVMGQRPRASSGRATTGHWPRASLGRAGRSIGGGRAGAAELVHGGRALALGEVLRRAVGGLSWAVVSGCVKCPSRCLEAALLVGNKELEAVTANENGGALELPYF
jgi:hypothetical protein